MPTRTSAVVAALACLSFIETLGARSCQIANKFASAATLACLSFVETLCARSCQIANKFLVREPCHYDEMRQRFLSLRDVQNAWRGNPLASRSPHCVRDDNLHCVRDDNLHCVRDDNLYYVRYDNLF